jgi:Asp-tRNA(Asn)/Glu-tRNA(Gln) amidotransferase B subunit
MFARGDISSAGAKAIIGELMANGGEPNTIAKAKGLLQMKDASLIGALADEILAEHPTVALEVKSGKIFLV